MGSISTILHNRLNSLSEYEMIGGLDSAFSAGKIPGSLVIHKFGGGLVQPTERTIWDNMAAADYPFKFTNTPMTIVSTDVLDTGQTIRVYYIELVSADWVYKKGVAVTNGITPVTVQEADEDFVSLGTDAAIMFPYRIGNKGTGQNAGNMVGTLTVANGGTTYAQIRNGYNQSLMAIFPVATGYSVFVHSIGRAVVGSAKACIFTYSAMPFGECRQAKIVKGLSDGSADEVFDLPHYFGEKTILSVRAKIDSGEADVTGNFDLILIENTYL